MTKLSASNKTRTLPQVDTLMLVFVIALLVFVNLRSGPISSPDTLSYSAWADLLIQHQFNFLAYYGDVENFIPTFFYTLPVTIIAVLKAVIGSNWTSYYLGVNLTALTAMMVIFQRTARLLGIRASIIALSIGAFAISVDHLLWPHYLLSDTIFSTLVVFAVFIALRDISKGKSFSLLLGLSLLLLLLSRPSSPPVIVAIAISVALTKLPFKVGRWGMLGSIGILIFVSAGTYGLLMDAVLSGALKNQQLLVIGGMVREGMVVHDRPDTFITLAPSVGEIAKLFLLRLFAFFSPYASTFSTLHHLLNFMLFGFILCAFVIWLLGPSKSDNQLRNGANTILLLGICVALFHSAILIDYDWRYRYPVIAPFLLFSAIGFERGLRWLEQCRAQPKNV